MDREERNGVFREASKGRAGRRERLRALAHKQRLLVRWIEAMDRPVEALLAREIAEGLERIGDVQ